MPRTVPPAPDAADREALADGTYKPQPHACRMCGNDEWHIDFLIGLVVCSNCHVGFNFHEYAEQRDAHTTVQ